MVILLNMADCPCKRTVTNNEKYTTYSTNLHQNRDPS